MFAVSFFRKYLVMHELLTTSCCRDSYFQFARSVLFKTAKSCCL